MKLGAFADKIAAARVLLGDDAEVELTPGSYHDFDGKWFRLVPGTNYLRLEALTRDERWKIQQNT